MYRESTVYITKEDKEKLENLIKDIGEILESYPYSNDPSDHFITTMSRTKGAYVELKHCASLLDIKQMDKSPEEQKEEALAALKRTGVINEDGTPKDNIVDEV